MQHNSPGGSKRRWASSPSLKSLTVVKESIADEQFLLVQASALCYLQRFDYIAWSGDQPQNPIATYPNRFYSGTHGLK